MATKIRFKRIGRRNRPFYRLVVIDSRKRRDGAPIEQLGWYDPIKADKESNFSFNEDKIIDWLKEGAQVSDSVKKLMKRSGLAYKWHLIKQGLSDSEIEKALKKWKKERRKMTPHETHDTISVLVQDKNGDMAGACTTSGWAYKMHGRVGDSPIIGAGLFVDNEIGCAAATGLGEEVIKTTGSFLVVELMRQGYGPTRACEEALNRVIKAHNGDPDFQIGYIALRKDGKIGAACLKWSFEYALAQKGENKLHKVIGLI